MSVSTVELCFLPSRVPGELPTPNTTTPAVTTPAPTVQSHNCSDGEFVCVVHGECVASSKVCDFRQDCSDGSDEINCGKTFIFSSLTFHCIILSFTMLLPVFQLMFPFLLYLFTFLSPVKEQCDFEGGDICGWKSVDSSLIPSHAFRWSPDQGESIHIEEQYHRPINDHTL